MSYKVGNITVTISGQSHSDAMSVILEGIPAGIQIDMERLMSFMDRRRPGKNIYSTPRSEADKPRIISGIFNGITCGSSISAVIENTNTKSSDYNNISKIVRPGHADYCAHEKFKGYNDYRGGGQFSGRLTSTICFAGAICLQVLEKQGIKVMAHISSIKEVSDISYSAKIEDVSKKDFPVIDDNIGSKMKDTIEAARMDLDSVGGTIECAITGVPVGIGDAEFEGLDGEISKAIFGIPAVKGIEFGRGFDATTLFGSENNDEFQIIDDKITTKTNNHGGILGGITSGMPIIFKVAIKPTSSISKPQHSVDVSSRENAKLIVKGRHDPCIVPRAVPCIEAACAIALLGKMNINN